MSESGGTRGTSGPSGTSTAAPAPPVLRVAGDIADALAPTALATIDGEALAAFLEGRRWYGAKSEHARAARFAGVVPVRAPGLVAAVTRVEVELGEGRTEWYQLPLVVRGEGRGAGGADDPHAVLARVEAGEERGVLVDAVGESGFRDWLWDAFAHGATIQGGDIRLVVEPMDARDGVEPDASRAPRPASRLLSSEQSNTSIVYGDRAILKLFRRIESGESPDVEISRFLTTRAHFPNTPALLGVARLEERGGKEGAAAGMLQRLVPGATDAFVHALERARLESGGAPGSGHDESFVRDAARLGAITRAMHEALASDAADPAFAPRAAGPADVARWVAGAERTVAAGLSLLERALARGSLPRRVADAARAIAARGDELRRLLAGVAPTLGGDAGQLVRHHGDYHLGQVLRAADGDFMIIDFEGEPARPLAERRAPHSALRDVAGMVRSFAYAAAMAGSGDGDAGRPAAAARSSQWERAVRDAFMEGYFRGGPGTERPAAFLPREREHADALLALFETEKVFYELAYELNNRPDWAWVPLAGIARLLEARRSTENR